jgi:hypothetical protein
MIGMKRAAHNQFFSFFFFDFLLNPSSFTFSSFRFTNLALISYRGTKGEFIMSGTIIAFIIAILILFSGFPSENTPFQMPGYAFLILPVTVLALYIIAYVFAFAPLQKAEQNLTPRILELFRKDHRLGLLHLGISTLILFLLFLGIDAYALHLIPSHFLLAALVISFGASIDLLHYFLKRMLHYLNPFQVVQMFTQAAKHSIQSNKETDLCDSIDALAEIGNRALDKSASALCIEAINELQATTTLFLVASKSISHPVNDAETQALGIKDKVSFTLFFLFQRLEMLYEKALNKRLEPVCSHIETTLGKIAISAAHYDLSLASYPLHFMGKFAADAESAKMPEVGVKTSCILLEVARMLLAEIDLTYQDLKEPFFSMITQLDEIGKAIFRRDKTSNFKLLTQPFRDLNNLFSSDRVANHPDTPIIISDINRVLAEYEALELVMKTMPPLPTFGADEQEKASPPPEDISTKASETPQS